jgi:hypothetical protein
VKPLTPEIEYCRATVRKWERLRILYNIILLIPGVAVIWRILYLGNQMGLDHSMAFDGNIFPIGDPLELIASALTFGLVANICYCLGPYTEFVITALGFPISGARSRYLIFGIGVMISLGVVALPWVYVEYYVVSSLIPGP